MTTLIDTMVWAGQESLVLSCSLHRGSEDAEEVCWTFLLRSHYLAALCWQKPWSHLPLTSTMRVQRVHSPILERWLITFADLCSVMQYDIPVCVVSWTSWQPETDQDPQGLKVVQITTVMADPDQQPGGHYHQSLVSTWQVAVTAHGKASDNHIIVFGEKS